MNLFFRSILRRSHSIREFAANSSRISFRSLSVARGGYPQILLREQSSMGAPKTEFISRRFQKITKSVGDKREYRGLELNNGLRVLLISDPSADKSAASMDVAVGHLMDPWELPGLAHFCEHMLFLGTDKYPSENEYSKFISSHGGCTNAFTSSDHTNYHFDVSSEYLKPSLDRFVQFFLCPQFTESATEREVCAVDSENSNNLQNDAWRVIQLERSLSKPGHDYGKFGTGNKQTLMTDPRKKGIEPREALLKFHKEYYSSDIMTFAVLGRESLDELERMVVELDFGCIEAKGITRKVWDDSPYSSSCLMKKIEIVPVKDLRQLTLAFPIPDYTDEYRTQPAHYVSHLLGHEGPGSLLSALKRQGWVSSLTAGGRVLARGFGVFNISVDLSEEGLKHIPDIIELAFCSIGVINSAQPLKWVHEELRQLADMKFRFKDKEVPINYVTHLSSDLQRIPFENILNSEYQMDVFKPDLISELLGMLTPQKLMYFAVSQDYAGRPGNVNEKWYGTEYQQFPLDERFLEKCSTALKCGGHDSLHIPSKNEYIATKFDLKPREKEDSDVPKLIKDDTWVRLWFMQDREFLLPKANIKLAIHSPFMSSNPFNAFLSTMYVVCFQDALAEETYNPFLAGLSGSVEIHAAGLFISISGYDEKQKLLLKHLVHRLVNFVPESHRFEVLKEVLCRNLRNFRQNQPYLQSHYFAGMILIEKHWSKEELLACAEECTLEKLKAFISDALRAFYVEGLVFGNVTEDESLSLVKEAVSELRTVPGSRPLFPSEISLNRVHELPAGSAHIFKEFQETHPNAAVDFILQTGVQSSLANVLLELIVQIAAEPAFNQLRTNEQLGYIVHTGVRRAHGTQSIEFIIQGQNDPEFMQDRIENFLRILRQRVESMSDQEFHDNIEAVAVKRLEKPKTMGAKASRFWSEIELGYYHFNRENVEVPELRRIKKSEVLSYFDTYLMVDSPQRRKLCTMVYANTQTAEEVEKNEIHTRVKRGASGDIVTRGKDLRIDDIHAFKSQLSLYPLPQPVLEIPPLASCNARRPS